MWSVIWVDRCGRVAEVLGEGFTSNSSAADFASVFEGMKAGCAVVVPEAPASAAAVSEAKEEPSTVAYFVEWEQDGRTRLWQDSLPKGLAKALVQELRDRGYKARARRLRITLAEIRYRSQNKAKREKLPSMEAILEELDGYRSQPCRLHYRRPGDEWQRHVCELSLDGARVAKAGLEEQGFEVKLNAHRRKAHSKAC